MFIIFSRNKCVLFIENYGILISSRFRDLTNNNWAVFDFLDENHGKKATPLFLANQVNGLKIHTWQVIKRKCLRIDNFLFPNDNSKNRTWNKRRTSILEINVNVTISSRCSFKFCLHKKLIQSHITHAQLFKHCSFIRAMACLFIYFCNQWMTCELEFLIMPVIFNWGLQWDS